MEKLFRVSLALSALPFVSANISCAADATTVSGEVADSNCAAKFGSNNDIPADKVAECAKKCIKAGARMVVVTDHDQKVLTVDNPEKLKGYEGHHVTVSGHIAGNSIHVESAKAL
jgi:methionine aminopeptidase